MSSRRCLLVVLLAVLLVLPATAVIGLADNHDTGNETGVENATGNETASDPATATSSEENESGGENESDGSDDGEGAGGSGNESESESESEGDGSTPQVTIFPQGENQPAVTPDNNESGGSNESGGENESGNASSETTTLGDLSGEGSSEDEGSTSVVNRPSTEGVVDKFIGRIGGVLYRGGIVLIDDIINEGLGTPVPENNGYRGILGYPEEGSGMYADVYHDYYLVKIIPPMQDLVYLLAGFVCIVMVPSSPFSGYDAKKGVLLVIAGTILVVMSWELATFMHYSSDAVTQHMLPDGEDILNKPENGEGIATMESTSGVIGTLLGVSIFGWNVGMFLLTLHGARHVLLTALPAWLGVILILQWLGPVQIVRQAGSTGFWGYVGLLVMNWPTAALLGVANAVGFTFGFEGAAGTFTDFGATIGLFTVAAFLPVLVQGVFFLAPMFVMYKKGSVASVGRSYARNRWGIGADGHREKRGGGYAGPNRHHTTDNAQQQTQRRRRAATDGGTSGASGSSGGGLGVLRPSPAGTPGVKAVGGSKSDTSSKSKSNTSRRREIHNQIQRRQSQRFGEAKDGYRSS